MILNIEHGQRYVSLNIFDIIHSIQSKQITKKHNINILFSDNSHIYLFLNILRVYALLTFHVSKK